MVFMMPRKAGARSTIQQQHRSSSTATTINTMINVWLLFLGVACSAGLTSTDWGVGVTGGGVGAAGGVPKVSG